MILEVFKIFAKTSNIIVEDREKVVRLSQPMLLPEEIMRRKVVTSKLAMSTAADFDLLICRYIQIKEVKVK